MNGCRAWTSPLAWTGQWMSLLTFRLTDYFLLLALLIVAVSFLDERRAGLWSVVYAAPRGRLGLAVRRTLILFGASAAGVLLLHGTDLVLGFALYGGAGDLDRTVQSVQLLGKLTLQTTVRGFLVRYFLLRIASAFLIGLILWLLLSAIHNVRYTILVAAAVLAVEYGLYTLLPVQSVGNVLKYFNLFTYISLSDLYTDYLNIDLLGFPLGIRSISQRALIPLCLVLTILCLSVHCHKRPAAGRDLLGSAAYRLNRVTDRFLGHLYLFGMEVHKTMWVQKGVVLAALTVYAAFRMPYSASIPISSAVERAERQYTAALAGEITDATFAAMDADQADLDTVIAAYVQAQIDFDRGSIGYPELDRYRREAESAETKRSALAEVRTRCLELQGRGAAEHFTPWLIEETPFESVYGRPAQSNQQQAALLSLLALTLLLAGSLSYERQSGMVYLLRSTAQGRRTLVLRKLLLIFLETTLVWAVVYSMELHTLRTRFAITAWGTPAKNLSMLEDFPLSCSITAFLVQLYAFRWLTLFCCGGIVLFLSSFPRRMEMACLAASAVMLLPSLLYAATGIGVFRPFAVILPVAVLPVLLDANGAPTHLVWHLIALLGAAGWSEAYLLHRSREKKA